MAGAPAQSIGPGAPVHTVGLRGSDFADLRPDFQVELGDRVEAGAPLFVDRKRPEIRFVSPVAGRITAITRGHRRVLDSLVLAVEGEQARTFTPPAMPDAATMRSLLLEAGLWPSFRARPFETIPDPDSEPADLFVTAMDTAPLAADPAIVIGEQRDAFAAGVAAIAHLTPGRVFVCQAPGEPLAAETDKIRCVRFSGRHPAGLPGTHIHKLSPVRLQRSVWHIGYQHVIAIGVLMQTGRLAPERVVALGGAMMQRPRLVRTLAGADLGELVADELQRPDACIVSGSPLAERRARFLGYYDRQVVALDPAVPAQQDSWMARAFGGAALERIIPLEIYDDVLPFGLPATPLLRALSVGDSETARRLGCLELAEEDLMLVRHVCPARLDYPAMLRGVLNDIGEHA